MAKTRKSLASKVVSKQQRELGELDLKNFLLSKPDELIDQAGLDEDLDKRLERSKLIGGTKHPNLVGDRMPYSTKFPLEFYRQIYRLWGWHYESDQDLCKKPGVVAKITAYLIYMRFPVGVLRELQVLNYKNGDGLRLFKHFQWLTPEGERLLKLYISESISLMSKHTRWSEFIKDFTINYNNPYGLSWDNY